MVDGPLLIYYIFGHEASLVVANAGERLLAWAKAFGDWLAILKAKHPPNVERAAKNSWRELYNFVQKMPWEITKEDLERFVSSQERTEAARITICRRLTDISNFYKFVHENQIDRKWAEPIIGSSVLNPAEGVSRPVREIEERVGYLDVEEMNAFLQAIEKEGSIMGRRDYAFFLVLLLTAIYGLQGTQLRWMDLERGEDTAWIHVFPKNSGRWKDLRHPEIARRIELGKEGWEAIYDYLQESGRLSGMRSNYYVFAPMKNPLTHTPSGEASDWRENQPICKASLKMMINRYARSGGLDFKKVTYECIRNTAIVRRLEAGDEPRNIQDFLGLNTLASTTRYLNSLTGSPHESKWSEEPFRPIVRGPYRFKPGIAYGLKHGLYQKNSLEYSISADQEGIADGGIPLLSQQDPEASQEEPGDNLTNEIEKFRRVMDRVYKLMEKMENLEEGIRLLDVYGKAINRLSISLKAQSQLPNEKPSWQKLLESVVTEIVEKDDQMIEERKKQQGFEKSASEG